MQAYNLVSLAGIPIFLVLAWLCSTNRRNVNWRLIGWGLGLQMLFALFIFVVPAGASVFMTVNHLVIRLLDTAAAGVRFVFGTLALSPGEAAEAGAPGLGFILAFQGLPTIIFFSALVAVLYHFRIMPLIIRGFAWMFTKTMRISGAESLAAASNIFVGVESAITVRPFLERMTRSELCTVLTAGMATVASNVLVLYVNFLRDIFPAIAGHLVSASILSAPAAVVMAKILLPEDGAPETLGLHVRPHFERARSWFEAILSGANAGVQVVIGVTAMLIAVLGLVALLDLGLNYAGGGLNDWLGLQVDWSLRGLLGYLFYPFTLLLGIPPADAALAARIIGERSVVTELVAYQDLAAALEQNLFQHPRSAVITTYALCGFAHVASIAIFVGGVAALVPQRTGDLAQVGFRALLAATLACLLTACVAGTFFTDSTILLGN